MVSKIKKYKYKLKFKKYFKERIVNWKELNKKGNLILRHCIREFLVIALINSCGLNLRYVNKFFRKWTWYNVLWDWWLI